MKSLPQKTEDQSQQVATNPMLLSWLQKPLETALALKTETMVQAIESPSMSIGMLNKFKAGTSNDILTFMLGELTMFFNVDDKNTFNATQITQTVNLILGDYQCRNLKPEDFKVIFDNAKKGVYGKTYNRLDGQVVFDWIQSYIKDRTALIEESNYREHNHRKENEKSNLIPPQVVEMYKEILKNVKKAEEVKIADTPKLPKPPRQKTEKEKLIQVLFAEFDSKWDKKPYTGNRNSTARFIEVDGEILGQAEYVEKMLARALEQNKD